MACYSWRVSLVSVNILNNKNKELVVWNFCIKTFGLRVLTHEFSDNANNGCIGVDWKVHVYVDVRERESAEAHHSFGAMLMRDEQSVTTAATKPVLPFVRPQMMRASRKSEKLYDTPHIISDTARPTCEQYMNTRAFTSIAAEKKPTSHKHRCNKNAQLFYASNKPFPGHRKICILMV